MGTARYMLGGAGALSGALAFGGSPPADTTQTEEFQRSILTFTPAAWAAGGNLGTARYHLSGAGTQTAGLAFAWATYPPTTNKNESQYNMQKKLELSESDHRKLINYCKIKKIEFLSSSFDIQSTILLKKLNLKRLKIPSGEITNYPNLCKIADTCYKNTAA